jgi:molybdenum cofactor cytidylyltransferase
MESFISGVILAAGESKRFTGYPPKQLLKIQEEPLIHLITRQALASKLSEVVVVLGYQSEVIKNHLSDLHVSVIFNKNYSSGQSSSVKAGLESIHSSATAVLFIPIDQPFLTDKLFNQLITAHEKGTSLITLPTYQERRGAPVIFDRILFPELSTITGDEGGRQILKKNDGEIQTVALDTEDPLLDIDTPSQYQKLLLRD